MSGSTRTAIADIRIDAFRVRLREPCHQPGPGGIGALAVENVEGGAFSDQGMVEEPIPARNGRIALSDRPGLGVPFDRAALASHRAAADAKVDWVDPARFFNDAV